MKKTNNKNLLPMQAGNYTLRYFPPAIKVFLNSVYSFNKSFVKNLPQADNIVFKIIKGYFTLNLLSENKEGKKSRLLVRRYKKLSLNRIIVSKPEIKHSGDHVMITLYVYNKKKHSIIYRVKQIYESLIWGKQGNILKKDNTEMAINLLNINNSLKKENKIRILNKLNEKKNKNILHTYRGFALKSKLNKNGSYTTSLKNRVYNKNIMINTSSRYNLKMNFLLDQDREYTASFRSFNYVKKKIYIVIGRRINIYTRQAKKAEKITIFSEYMKPSKKVKKNILPKVEQRNFSDSPLALNIRCKAYKASINKRKIGVALNLTKKIVWYWTVDLINLKPRIKDVKVRFNILMYRNWSYLNKKIRRNLFDRYKAKKTYIRSRTPISTKKKYHNAVIYKQIRVINFQSLGYKGLSLSLQNNKKKSLQASSKHRVLPIKTYIKQKIDQIKLKKNQNKYLKNHLIGSKIKNTSVKNLIENKKKRNFICKLQLSYKPINNFKKSYLVNGLNHDMYNKKYISGIKFKYNPYKGLNTNLLKYISLLKKLHVIDLSFVNNTKLLSRQFNDILQDNNFTSPYREMTNLALNNNIAKQESSIYVKLKNLLKINLLGELLHREMLYTYYIRKLYINNLVFKTGFINYLCNIISKVYNKKVILNIVSLKYLFFNSDIFTQAITTRLKNHKKNRISKVLQKVFGLVYLAKINEYAYNIHNPIYKYIDNFNNKYKHLRSHLGFTNNSKIKPSNTNIKTNNIKLKGFARYNLNHILFNQINFIKCKSVFGIKLEAKGRLTKRSTASRKIFKVKYLGNLRLNNTINNSNTSYIIKNNMISNVQFSKIAGKTRIGSFGIKGWINNN